LADGPYTVGLRPHRVQPHPGAAAGSVAVEGRVAIAEISGSESVVHFDLQGSTWVSQSHGVRDFDVGATASFVLDVSRAMYFGADGRRVGSAEE
ncbi:MAG: TOBE domain-containing protein, partial [Steroidobacteraceae bacterium]